MMPTIIYAIKARVDMLAFHSAPLTIPYGISENPVVIGWIFTIFPIAEHETNAFIPSSFHLFTLVTSISFSIDISPLFLMFPMARKPAWLRGFLLPAGNKSIEMVPDLLCGLIREHGKSWGLMYYAVWSTEAVFACAHITQTSCWGTHPKPPNAPVRGGCAPIGALYLQCNKYIYFCTYYVLTCFILFTIM